MDHIPIEASYIGYQNFVQDNVFLALGENTRVDISLTTASAQLSVAQQLQHPQRFPANASEITFVDFLNSDNRVRFTAAEQETAFQAYLDNDKYLRKRIGKYTERNGATTPWEWQEACVNVV